MNAQTVTAIAYLLSEALAAGVSIVGILEEAKATGRVPPERWDTIMKDLFGGVAAWDAARTGE